nr:hypothetical protein [Phocaeicola coprocola]
MASPFSKVPSWVLRAPEGVKVTHPLPEGECSSSFRQEDTDSITSRLQTNVVIDFTIFLV